MISHGWMGGDWDMVPALYWYVKTVWNFIIVVIRTNLGSMLLSAQDE